MTRSEYLRLTAAVSDRWAVGGWDDTLIESWWPQFAPHDLAAGVKAVKALQREGHGPFAPDPGLVLRHLRAASPGGGRYAVGRHAAQWDQIQDDKADKATVSEAISACRRILAERRTGNALNAAQEAPEGP